jgi:hypothetical protein
MAVIPPLIGVIPTKVSDANAVIRRGDFLVAAPTAGPAMKAGKRIPTGAVVGTSFADCTGPGVIEMFANVR